MGIFKQIYSWMWMQQPAKVRQVLIEEFHPTRSSFSHVVSEGTKMKQIADGYTDQDLAVITIERMQAFTGSQSTDLEELWNLTCKKASGEEIPVPVVEEPKEVKPKKK